VLESFAGAEGGTLALLALGLAIAFGFEFVNGFHDTANAVATVIYTRSLRPGPAVVWSGVWNAVGVLHAAATGLVVAFSIVHLLPVDLLVSLGPGAGLAMVFSLLLAAVLWNLGTWYLGLPASSSHTQTPRRPRRPPRCGGRRGRRWTRTASAGASRTPPSAGVSPDSHPVGGCEVQLVPGPHPAGVVPGVHVPDDAVDPVLAALHSRSVVAQPTRAASPAPSTSQ